MREKEFLRLKISITFISLLFSFLAKSDSNWMNWSYIDWCRIKEITYDLSIGVFSSMVLVWFIDEINERIQKRKEERQQYELILQYHQLLQLRISRYINLFYCVATPISNRSVQTINMPESFTFRDMRDLFKPSMDFGNGIKKSAVEAFLDAECELRNEIIRFISNTHLEHDSELAKILIEYLKFSIGFDCRFAIVDAPKTETEGEKFTDSISKGLVNDAEKYNRALLEGTENTSHQLYPYIRLRELMQHERLLILSCQCEIESIIKTFSTKRESFLLNLWSRK